MQRGTVLVVEDYEAARLAIVAVLTTKGYVVHTAGDGAGALDFLRRDPSCGIVILDWRLPGMDGGKVLAAMRADPKLVNVPVILVTANRVTRESALAAGATDYFPKPFAPDALLAAVARHLRSGEITR